MIWWGYHEEIERWLDKVISGKQDIKAELVISDSEIE